MSSEAAVSSPAAAAPAVPPVPADVPGSAMSLLGVDYFHMKTGDGGDLYLTHFGLPFWQNLLPENWYAREWFEAKRERLEGTSMVYKVPTRPVDGTALNLVVKWSRVGEVRAAGHAHRQQVHPRRIQQPVRGIFAADGIAQGRGRPGGHPHPHAAAAGDLRARPSGCSSGRPAGPRTKSARRSPAIPAWKLTFSGNTSCCTAGSRGWTRWRRRSISDLEGRSAAEFLAPRHQPGHARTVAEGLPGRGHEAGAHHSASAAGPVAVARPQRPVRLRAGGLRIARTDARTRAGRAQRQPPALPQAHGPAVRGRRRQAAARPSAAPPTSWAWIIFLAAPKAPAACSGSWARTPTCSIISCRNAGGARPRKNCPRATRFFTRAPRTTSTWSGRFRAWATPPWLTNPEGRPGGGARIRLQQSVRGICLRARTEPAAACKTVYPRAIYMTGRKRESDRQDGRRTALRRAGASAHARRRTGSCARNTITSPSGVFGTARTNCWPRRTADFTTAINAKRAFANKLISEQMMDGIDAN